MEEIEESKETKENRILLLLLPKSSHFNLGGSKSYQKGGEEEELIAY